MTGENSNQKTSKKPRIVQKEKETTIRSFDRLPAQLKSSVNRKWGLHFGEKAPSKSALQNSIGTGIFQKEMEEASQLGYQLASYLKRKGRNTRNRAGDNISEDSDSEESEVKVSIPKKSEGLVPFLLFSFTLLPLPHS